MPYPEATGTTDHMWSMCPWVRTTATGRSPSSRTISSTPAMASLPGSTTMHSEPLLGATT